LSKEKREEGEKTKDKYLHNNHLKLAFLITTTDSECGDSQNHLKLAILITGTTYNEVQRFTKLSYSLVL
jgi:hypothetical protein